ncbi:hypothetical protein DV735_g472, partial [Chaetothyriales sp. CBS 134920]
MPSAGSGMAAPAPAPAPAALKPRASHSTRPQESGEVSLRRLKKRETDRRCQREARERTKSRIAYLEQLAEELRCREARALQQLRESEAEKAEMARTLDMLQTGLDPPNGLIKFHDNHSRASFSPPDSISVLASFDQPDISLGPPDCGSSLVTQGQMDNLYPPPTVVVARPQKDASQISCGACGNHIGRDSGRSSIWQGNFWRFACEVLEERFEWPEGLQPAADTDSDDVPIRALLHGWDAVQRRGRLHPTWQLLSRIDEMLFSNMPKPERLAMLKAMHLLLQFSLQPSAERFMRLPSWYSYYRPSQALPHTYAIDFFAWPGFRDRFVLNPHAYCGNDFWHLYQRNMRLLWSSHFTDCFTHDPATGLFSTTAAFNTRIRDIKAWTMAPDFFARFPELVCEIPATNTIPQPVSLQPWMRRRWWPSSSSLPSPPASSSGTVILAEEEYQQQDHTASASAVEAEFWSPSAAHTMHTTSNLDLMPSPSLSTLSTVSGRARTLLPKNAACLSL